MTHRLQTMFASVEGEVAYVDRLRALIESGDLDRADAILTGDLGALDSDLALTCLSTSCSKVTISGWPELIEAISLFEGDPIMGVAIGMANDYDLAFEKEGLHTPFVTLGLYTNEAFDWPAASRDDILGQCSAEEPAWAGCEEDIEAYLEVEGLAVINSAIIRHKRQYFLRDDNPPKAPLAYVECLLAGWFRALRFHQAVAAELAAHGLPGSIPVVSGTVGMRPDVATVHYPEKAVEVALAEVASLIITAKPKRMDMITDLTGSHIRRQVVAANDQIEEKPGFFKRLFGRR